MSRRAAVFVPLVAQVAVSVAVSTTPTSALELVWSTGSRDVAVVDSAPCTLLVRTTRASESLPQEWHLAWTARGTGTLRLAIQEVPPQGGFADVCTLATAAAPAGLAARTDTVFFCTGSATRATVARYVILVEGGVVAKVKLVPVTGSLAADSLEVTVNGGVAQPYPPLPFSARESEIGGLWTASVEGADLDQVTSARYRAGEDTTALQIVSQSAGSLAATATMSQLPPDGFLELVNGEGFIGAVDLARAPPRWVPDRFLVRFRAGEVEPPLGLTDGPAAEFQYRSPELGDSLTALGVTRLQRLLPWFRHADVNSVNLLGEPVVLEDLADLYVAQVLPGSDIAQVSRRANGLAGVRYACPDWILRPATPPPDDPYFGDQWGFYNTGQQPCGWPGLTGRDIDALHAWDFETGTSNIRVGILDTGILAGHPELVSRVVLDTSFVDYSGGSDTGGPDGPRHGTAVAGIVAAATGNGVGVAGVARGVSLWSIKVCDDYTGCPASSVISGIDRARIKGLPIVNMSLGVLIPGCPQGAMCVEALLPLNEVCLQAYLSGMFLVASSGNAVVQYNGTEELSPVWPAAYYRRVFAVGAHLNNGQRWNDRDIDLAHCSLPLHYGDCKSSNYSPGDPWLDVVAPGGRYIVTTRDTAAAYRYYTLTGCVPNNVLSNTGFGGTSAAAPMVAGIAALLKSENYNLTGDDFEQIIIRTTQAPAGGYAPEIGYGRVRAGAALESIVLPKVVLRDSLRAVYSQLTVADSTVLYDRRFIEVGGLPQEDYTTSCVRYRLHGTWRFTPAFQETPWARVRGSGTLGWRDTVVYDQSDEVPGGKVVSISADSVVFETNVYRIRDRQDTTVTLGWHPTIPVQARISCTAVGVRTVVAVEEGGPRGADFAVEVRPNPVRRQAWIDLTLPHAGMVDLEVFDLAGRRVATLLQGPLGAGRHSVMWNGQGPRPGAWRAGMYYLRCGFSGREIVRRLVLLGVAR